MISTKTLISASCLAILALAFSGCGNSVANTTSGNSTAAAENSTNKSETANGAKSTQKTETKTNSASDSKNSTVYTPEKDSPERKAIFDALRVPVVKRLKQDVQFVADKFNVQGDWAFIGGSVKNAKGGEANWKITEFAERIDSGDFDDNLFALMKKSGDDGWTVVAHEIGCLDVCYGDWETKYKAPKAIF